MLETAVLTDANFKTEVLESALPVMVDFWAPWCGPCRAIAPVVDALAKEYAGKVKVMKLDVDDASETAAEYGITSIPCLMVFKDGKKVGLVVGAVPKSSIEKELQKHI